MEEQEADALLLDLFQFVSIVSRFAFLTPAAARGL